MQKETVVSNTVEKYFIEILKSSKSFDVLKHPTPFSPTALDRLGSDVEVK